MKVNSSPHRYQGFFQGSLMSLLDTEFAEGRQWLRLGDAYEITKRPRGLDMASLPVVTFVPMDAIPQGGTYAPDYTLRQPSEIRSGTYFERGDALGCQDYAVIRERQASSCDRAPRHPSALPQRRLSRFDHAKRVKTHGYCSSTCCTRMFAITSPSAWRERPGGNAYPRT